MKNIMEIQQQDIPKNCFTFIRMVLCIFVIIDHTSALTGILFRTGLSGSLSVPAFFIISGFWITKSFFSSVSIKEYIAKRVKRIIPQLWIVLWLSAIIFFFFTPLNIKDYFLSSQFIRYILKSIFQFTGTALPGLFIEDIVNNGAINGSCWTIHIEIAFYILLPLIIILITNIYQKLAGGRCLNVVANICIICICLITVLAHFVIPLFFKEKIVITVSYELKFFTYFFSGMLLYFNFNIFLKYYRIIFFPSLILTVIFCYSKWVIELRTNITVLSIFYPIILATFIFSFAFLMPNLEKIFKSGDLSYGMYILHFPIIRMLSLTNLFTLYPILGVIIVFLTTYSLALILDNYIQKTILNFKKKNNFIVLGVKK